MINKNIKSMLLFITLCILLIGIVSATDVDSNTTEQTHTISEKIVSDTPDTVSEVKENVINDNKEEVKKNTKTESIKTSGQIQTKISIDPIPDIYVDESVFIMGTFTDINGNPLRNTHLKLDVDGDSYYAETYDDGFYLGEYIADTPGTKTVTVSWAGNTKYAPTTSKTTFHVEGPKQTYIVLNNVKDVNSSEYVTISGYYYYDQNKPLKQTTMTININGSNYYAKTNNNGYFTYNYKTTNPGTNKVTVSYAGTDKFLPATATKTFNVKYRGLFYTYIKLNNIKNVNQGDYTTISGYYYYNIDKPLKSTSMVININGAKYYSRTDNNGYFSYNYKTNKAGSNIVTVSYPGNSNFKAADITKTFNVISTGPQYTYINLNYINNVKNGEYTTISGYYYYGQNNPLKQTTMTININGNKYYARTNNNGYFSYNYKTNKAGSNTVTVSYPGNTNFKAASATKTFNVISTEPQYTYINLNYINNVNCGETTTISGYYYYGQNNPLKQTTMTININGNKYYARTNNNGYFSYNYKTNKAGSNTVTVSYPGNTNFKAASATKSFNVAVTDTITYLYSINSKEYGDTVYVNGYLEDENDNALKNTGVFLNINGKNYVARTDSYGEFSYNYKVNTVGYNTITATFNGTNNYAKSSDYVEFYVYSKDTILYVNNISSVSIGESVSISGRFTDDDYNPLKSTAVTININGNNYYARTDDYGYYSLNYKTQKGGTNNVTVSYPGNERYYGASDNTTFYVYKISTILTLNSISNTNYGDIAQISGRYTDENYNPLKSTAITININGNTYYARTDNYGYYSYNYKTNSEGTNYVDVSYPGNDKYYGDSNSVSFTVKRDYETIELYLYKSASEKYVGDDVFRAWYQTVDGQWYKGAYVEVYNNYGDYGDAPNHLILDATFYFQNSAGNIISRQYDDGNGLWMSHDLITGYTPYKVIAKYRKMTSREKDLWNSGYYWDPSTDSWHYYNENY